jgi:TetR/AcrR family transcriptional repressor of mexJK operon
MAGRGRPNKRDVILAAARDQFLARGFEGASVDAVVAAAGVSKPTVYAHFPTKEALLEAVVRAEVGRIGPSLAFAATGDPRADLERVAAALLGLATAPDALAWDRMMAGEARRSPALGRLFHDAGPGRVLGALADFFRALDRAGGLAVPDPGRAADFFFGLVVGAPLLAAQLTGHVPPAAEHARRARAAADVFLRGFALAGRPGRRHKGG